MAVCLIVAPVPSPRTLWETTFRPPAPKRRAPGAIAGRRRPWVLLACGRSSEGRRGGGPARSGCGGRRPSGPGAILGGGGGRRRRGARLPSIGASAISLHGSRRGASCTSSAVGVGCSAPGRCGVHLVGTGFKGVVGRRAMCTDRYAANGGSRDGAPDRRGRRLGDARALVASALLGPRAPSRCGMQAGRRRRRCLGSWGARRRCGV